MDIKLDLSSKITSDRLAGNHRQWNAHEDVYDIQPKVVYITGLVPPCKEMLLTFINFMYIQWVPELGTILCEEMRVALRGPTRENRVRGMC